MLSPGWNFRPALSLSLNLGQKRGQGLFMKAKVSSSTLHKQGRTWKRKTSDLRPQTPDFGSRSPKDVVAGKILTALGRGKLYVYGGFLTKVCRNCSGSFHEDYPFIQSLGPSLAFIRPSSGLFPKPSHILGASLCNFMPRCRSCLEKQCQVHGKANLGFICHKHFCLPSLPAFPRREASFMEGHSGVSLHSAQR